MKPSLRSAIILASAVDAFFSRIRGRRRAGFVSRAASRIIPVALLAAAAASASPAEAPQPSRISGPIVAMAPYFVQARPLTCFGLALQTEALVESKKILRMFIREVQPDSEASLAGLAPGTEILNIDGRCVRSFVARFDSESDLGRLFSNRGQGDRIRLVVLLPGMTEPRTVVLVKGKTREYFVGYLDWP
jgi:S1-C subfamily serine protease